MSKEKRLSANLIGWGVTIHYSTVNETAIEAFLDKFEHSDVERGIYQELIELESNGIVVAQRELRPDEFRQLGDLVIEDKIKEAKALEKEFRSDWKPGALKAVERSEARRAERQKSLDAFFEQASGILGASDQAQKDVVVSIVKSISSSSFFTKGDNQAAIRLVLAEKSIFPSELTETQVFNLNYHVRHTSNWAFENDAVAKFIDAVIKGEFVSGKYAMVAV